MWVVIVGLLVAIAWLVFSPIGPLNKEGQHLAFPQMPKIEMPGISVATLTQPETVLFMGTDVVYDGAGKHLHADKVALNGRSDTMMLVFFNPPNNKVSVLHIPRDTEAMIGKYGVQKINSANAIGGPEYAKTAVTQLLGVNIDHYVVMNIQALTHLVNELGGVTVEVPKKMAYMDWTAKLKIDLEPGVHTLTGNQAMGFVRFRHDELGDIGRVQRQQLFLHAVSRKMLDPRSWVHVPALIGIAQKNIDTDMSQMQLIEALNFAHGVPKENIRFVMLPGEFSPNGDWVTGFEAKNVAARLANPDIEIPVSRKNLSICVQNATTDPQFGWKLAQALRKLGYVVSLGKDEKDPISAKTRIIAQNGSTADAKMLQQDLGDVGAIMNASIGNLTTSITIIARDDITLDNIKLSSIDAPYLAPPPRPQSMLTTIARGHTKHNKRNAMNTTDLESTDLAPTPVDENSTLDVVPHETAPSREPLETSAPRTNDAAEARPSLEPAGAAPAPSVAPAPAATPTPAPAAEPAAKQTPVEKPESVE
jgi:polyisoprenyl-teichoic acid--peptidoglycan teichoic acid transferase